MAIPDILIYALFLIHPSNIIINDVNTIQDTQKIEWLIRKITHKKTEDTQKKLKKPRLPT